LPRVGPHIKSHVAKLRRAAQYAAVLNEPAAASLLELARKYEGENHLCCAYWVYKQAAELVPAPSALSAKERYAELALDANVVASAEICRELKWCHQAYVRAEALRKVKPEAAKDVFAQIVARAPHDSEVYLAAKKEVASAAL
jgi:hypothetical protein